MKMREWATTHIDGIIWSKGNGKIKTQKVRGDKEGIKTELRLN